MKTLKQLNVEFGRKCPSMQSGGVDGCQCDTKGNALVFGNYVLYTATTRHCDTYRTIKT